MKLPFDIVQGSPEIIDKYLHTLKEHQKEWAQEYPILKRIELMEQVLENVVKYKDEWFKEDLIARHIPKGHPEESTSYIATAGIVAQWTRLYIKTLRKIAAHGGNKPFAKARQDGDRVIVQTCPLNFKDKLVFAGIRGELRLQPGTKVEKLADYQAKAYKDKNWAGGIALVMAAGNVPTAIFGDLYQKLIVEKRVCIIKTNPILEYMGELLTKILAPFIKAGFVRIVNGGAVEGQYLSRHPLIDEIHMTGSDKTFEAIIYGGGEEGQKNKAIDKPLTQKLVTSELGNVTPVIVVPGDWSEEDLDYQASNIFTMLAINNGYACVAARVLILPKHWDKSEILIQKIEKIFNEAVYPVNYYPGTDQTINAAMDAYPNMLKYGELDANQQPWMFVKNLDASKDEPAFRREFWTSFMGQTFLDGKDKGDYLLNAVKFANEKLWGTLAASIIIDAASEKELSSSGQLQKAIDQLHYGTVITNAYPALALILGTSAWGGYPGATFNNIQSGNIFTGNIFMLDHIEKSVIFVPFHNTPKSKWERDKKENNGFAKAYAQYQMTQKLWDLVRLAKEIKK